MIGEDQQGGAHSRYAPDDMRYDECKRMLYEATSKDHKARRTIYADICARFRPVFRHFFMESFVEARHWYAKRLNYTHSVASSSIVGYVIGLGDRHVQNILIDRHTADLVHIDFGIAFEQGKNLPIPETVPFRLTRDIVDGFGACGLETTFRTSCERVLECLKHSREQILTIFQVLLYDPLFNWCVSPEKAIQLQRCNDNNNSNSNSSSSSHASDSRQLNDGDESNKENDSPIVPSHRNNNNNNKNSKQSASPSIECIELETLASNDVLLSNDSTSVANTSVLAESTKSTFDLIFLQFSNLLCLMKSYHIPKVKSESKY